MAITNTEWLMLISLGVRNRDIPLSSVNIVTDVGGHLGSRSNEGRPSFWNECMCCLSSDQFLKTQNIPPCKYGAFGTGCLWAISIFSTLTVRYSPPDASNNPFRVKPGINLFIIDREAREIMYLVASVRLSVCPSVSSLTAEPFDLRPWYLVCRLTLTLARLGL